MKNSAEILNELQSLSPLLAGMDKVNVFSVPQGYFDSIVPTVTACLKEENNNLKELIGNQPSFKVPQGYFEKLSDNILDKIKLQENPAEELNTLSPVLASIKKENVFEIPLNYFENLPGTIISKIQPKAAKVVYMQRRSSFMKYAAAAVITGAIALGVYKYSGNSSAANNNNTGEATASVKLSPSIEKGRAMDEKEFNESLNNLSDDEITQYLLKNGNESDIASLTSSLDENSLPSQDDYLLDEKTLDNYLKDLETNRQNN